MPGDQCGGSGPGALARQSQLGVGVAEVALHGPNAEAQPLGDLLVGQARGHQPQHLELARAQLLELGGMRRRRGRAEERVELERKWPKAGSVASRTWLALSSGRKPAPRDPDRQPAPLLEGDRGIAAGVGHQRRDRDVLEQTR